MRKTNFAFNVILTRDLLRREKYFQIISLLA